MARAVLLRCATHLLLFSPNSRTRFPPPLSH